MSLKKPLEQIIDDDRALQLLELAGCFFQYAEDARFELENLTIKLVDFILEPYSFNNKFGVDFLREVDRVILGSSKKESLIDFVKSRQANE